MVEAIPSGLLADYGLAIPVTRVTVLIISTVADTFIPSQCQRTRDHDSLP
jgi:hypothetical protein